MNAPDPSIWRVVGDPLIEGAATGPLRGQRVAVKDLYAVEGYPIGAGVPAWLREQEPATRSAPAVADLLAAGADVLGIAQTDQFAFSIGGINSHYGAPPNPAVPHATCGGSSNGPASAVALGQAEIGLGTDTAGSIRVPASYTGIVGFRSTHGAISMADTIALSPAFDAAGWLTRDVATAIAAGDTLLPAPDRVAWIPTRTLRLPAWRQHALPAVQAAADGCLTQLVRAGVLPPVEDVAVSADTLERWFLAYRTQQGWQAWQERGEWIRRHPGALGPDIAARFATASTISSSDADAAEEVVAEATAFFADLLSAGVLALPSTSTPAVPLSATAAQTESVRAATLRTTFVASAAGLPAVSLPLLSVPDSWRDATLPVGLSLVGAAGADHALLALSASLQAAFA